MGFSISAGASEIIWHDYENGLALGKSSQKKIMINFMPIGAVIAKKWRRRPLQHPGR